MPEDADHVWDHAPFLLSSQLNLCESFFLFFLTGWFSSIHLCRMKRRRNWRLSCKNCGDPAGGAASLKILTDWLTVLFPLSITNYCYIVTVKWYRGYLCLLTVTFTVQLDWTQLQFYSLWLCQVSVCQILFFFSKKHFSPQAPQVSRSVHLHY